MTTKKQEREALEQIKKILATLDPDGWVNTAFDGVVEQAEENIENDFACSYKSGFEYRGEQLAKAKEENVKLQKELQAANERIDSMKLQILSRDDMSACLYAVNQHKENNLMKADDAKEEIVKYADDPEGEEFQKAVKAHRLYTRIANSYSEIEERVAYAYGYIQYSK